jgi:hypothetical protein
MKLFMNQWDASALPDKQLFFSARMPLPPTISKHALVKHSRQIVRLNARLARYYVEAATALAQAPIHDFGLIVSLQENRFRVPLIANLKFYFPGTWRTEMEGQVNPVITATLHFLNLSRNPIVEMNIQRYIDVNNPHAEIALYCTSSWW